MNDANISIDQYNALQDNIKLLEQNNSNLKQHLADTRTATSKEVGALENEIKLLKERSLAIMKTEVTEYDSRFGGQPRTYKEYQIINPDIIASDIVKEQDKEVKELTRQLAETKRQIARNQQEVLDARLDFNRELNTAGEEAESTYKIQRDEMSRSFRKKENALKNREQEVLKGMNEEMKELNKVMDDLNEELQKERDNKTERELEKKRDEEVKTLKDALAKYQIQLENTRKEGPFTRFINFLMRTRAQKALVEEEDEINSKVNSIESSRGSSSSFRGMYYGG